MKQQDDNDHLIKLDQIIDKRGQKMEMTDEFMTRNPDINLQSLEINALKTKNPGQVHAILESSRFYA